MSVNSHIAILGAGESGVGAALLARKEGYSVWVSDAGPIQKKYRDELILHNIPFEENGHSSLKLLDADLIIKSPGIPDTAPVIKQLEDNGIEIISEIEFAYRHSDARTICVTGSNGKTTTTLLLHHILSNAGYEVGLAGNIGTSFARQVSAHNYPLYVLEVSSFQLDGIVQFRANTAIITNITPDHLDRYGWDMNAYRDAKLRILMNQQPGDNLIYCADDPILAEALDQIPPVATRYPYTLTNNTLNRGAYLEKNQIIFKTNKNPMSMTLEQLALQGKHNTYNSMAAGVAARLMDVRNESLKQSLSDFQNIAHRLEYVGSVHGIGFINDSKATNVNSTWYALENMDKPTVWIAGGVDKGNDYSSLYELVKSKVKAIVCLGLDNENIHHAFGSMVDQIIDTESAEDAVIEAYRLARKGDLVLLSPACSSFDLFENYEDRGNQFKQAVSRL